MRETETTKFETSFKPLDINQKPRYGLIVIKV